MPKQLNVNLAFTADTSKAKAQLQDLQKQLTQLTNTSLGKTKDLGMVKEIQDATAAAAQLKAQLESATNVSTGKLDLGRFNDSLKQSGMTLSDYKTQLDKLGPEGSKAFLSLAQSISNAEMPLRRTNALFKEFGVTLMNAARWQFSSSVLHGLMSAVQGAYGYAQDLNKSLTNIAIVTGQSTDQMAEFAEQANKSAQALSVSTTGYTDAALIYYQQGLSDKEVQARTDTTMKLSNVTGQSAEEVSSYMTAIWNNFAEGSNNLEHFADAITALGAHTASSSAEIAKGMQQFASVADTVGLSYENAAAALATIVAKTRQSESSVGNGLRTIFARLDSLKMGETLEDGVGLTKYTEALAKAGVQVLDQNGKLKDMDTILYDIGERWQTLDSTQKATLANTVGGVRQYSNLMALFDDFDKFKENAEIARNSDGSLQEQQERYAQGWEAAQKRVKAAWQAIYSDLIDDKFFISMLNGIEKVLKGVDDLIDSIGGIKGILITVSSLAATLLEKQMAEGIRNVAYSLKMMTSEGRAELAAKKEEAWDLAQQTSFDTGTASGAAQAAQISQTAEVQKALLANAERMTGEEQKIYQLRMDGLKAAQDEVIASGKELDNLRQQTDKLQEQMILKSKNVNKEKFQGEIGDFTRSTEKYALAQAGFNELKQVLGDTELNADKLESAMERLKEGCGEGSEAVEILKQELLKIIEQEEILDGEEVKIKISIPPEKKQELEELQNKIKALQSESSFDQAKREQTFVENTNADPAAVEAYTESIRNETQAEIEQEEATQRNIAAKEHLINDINNHKVAEQDLATTMVKSAQIVTSFMSALNMLGTALKTLQNPDLSGWEKFKSITLSIGMAIPMLVKSFSGFDSLMKTTAISLIANSLELNKNTLAKQKNTLATMEKDLAEKVNLLTMQGFTKEEALEHYVLEQAAIAKQKDAIATGTNATAHMTLATAIKTATAATLEFLAANPHILAIAAVLIGLVVAIKAATDAWNADAKAAEEAAKKAEEAKQKYQKTKQAFDELKSSLENHQNAVNALDDLKQGTEEWYEAVHQLNEETLDLITKYPELAGLVDNVNGSLRLNEEGMQKYLNDQYAEEQKGYIDVINTQQEAAKTDSQAKLTDTARNIQYGHADEVTTSTGTYTSGIKTASNEEVMAAVQAYIDSNGAAFRSTTALAEALKDSKINDAELIQALWDNKDTIGELADTMQVNTESSQNLKDAFIQSGVQNELGQEIQEDLDSVGLGAYASDVQQSLVDQVSRDLADAEQWTFEAYQEALQNARNNFEENKGQILDNLANKKAGDMATTLSNNSGAQYTSEQVRNYIESDALTDKEREVIIKYGIKEDSKSFSDIKESAVEKLKELKAEIENNPVEFDTEGLSKKQAEELKQEYADLTDYIKKNAEGIDELDDHLADCTLESSRVARSIIRFDDAIQDVTDNYEDWSKALESGSMQEAAKAANEMQKAYGNLMDIDGSVLSSQFLENADNLDLMKEAINGNEKAYNQLQEKANEDIIAQCDVDTTKFDAAMSEVQSHLDAMNFQELEIGADLDDGNFLNQLTELVNAAGMTAEQAEAYLANMGIDATVTKHTTDAEETQETASFHPTITEPAEVTGTAYTMNGDSAEPVDLPYKFYGVKYEPDKDQVTTSKENQAFTLEVTSAHKSSGGGFKQKNASHGGGGKGNRGGKGSCFIAGTPIILKDTFKNIETIKPGDIVLSYDEKNKKNVFNKVLQTMIHFVHERIYSLFIKDEKLKVTGNHKFLITRNNEQGWVQAADLKVGDLVLLSDGTLQKIIKINSELKHETVYNFEVSNTHNYYVGKNQVLAHNKGGGGGKNSAPKKQKREKPVKEKDRYHDLKEKIKDLTTETSRLEKIRNRVWGKEKLKYMDQEIKKQEKQIDLTKEYIKEAKNYLTEDKKRLDEIKMGAKYIKDDNTGEWLLTNYEEVLQNIVDAQNKAVNAFNDAKGRYENGEISEDELKAQEEAFNLDKEKFEERKKILKQYEDTYNTVQEQMEKLIDDQWKLYDLKLEKVKVEVELELKVSDQSKKILEWSFKYLGNDLDAVSDKVANLSSQMNYLAQDLATAQKGISGIFANHGINFNWNENTPVDQIIKDLKSQIGGSVYSALTESEVDALMEYMNKLMEIHDSAADKMKEVLETFSTAVEKANEKLERQFNRFDKLKSTLTTYKDIVDLTGKNILKITSKNLEDLNKAIISNDQNKLVSSRAIYATQKGEYEAARAELNEALASGDAQLVEQLQEQLDNLEDTMNESLESYRDALKETLEDVQQAWEDALDAMEEAYEKAFGDLGSNWYQEQFDRQKELNELYMPDYKKYHELNKSMTELQKNLANTNNQIVKGKAKELLEDINDKMKSGAQVSEYEAGIIERRVALLKAEDELLAARNAKTAVRMTRDNEGGFSYTYTADEDQVDNAEQGYSDAYYELRDFQVTGANDLQSKWLQIQGEFAQRVRDIEEQYRDNEAARVEALKQLQAEYQTYVNYFSDQMGVVYKWEATLRDNDLKDLQKVTGLKLDEWNTYITSWNDTLLNTVIPGYDTYDQLLETWDKAMNTAITSVNKAHNNYQKNVKVTMDNAGMSVSGFKEQFEKDMANVQIDSDNTTGNIKTLTETTMKNFKAALGEVSGFTQDYLNKFYSVREDNGKTITSIQNIVTALGGMNGAMDTANEKAQTLKTDTVNAISKAMTDITGALDGAANAAKAAGDAARNAFPDIKKTLDLADELKNKKYPYIKNGSVYYATLDFITDHDLTVATDEQIRTLYNTSGKFDTGGYTGDWHSSDGKLAVLHEKELVLNKEDTKNMLDAVNIIRSMQTPINGLARNMFNYNSLNNVGSADTLEQQVHIDATFPNVSDHNEIELALNNLVNSASQYVNRK